MSELTKPSERLRENVEPAVSEYFAEPTLEEACKPSGKL
jgi:hypothetical protein